MTDLPDVPGESQATAFVVSPEQILEPDAPVRAPAAPEHAGARAQLRPSRRRESPA